MFSIQKEEINIAISRGKTSVRERRILRKTKVIRVNTAVKAGCTSDGMYR
jgi:hypothetical protein